MTQIEFDADRMTIYPATVLFWSGGGHAGYCVEWYRDDDNNSGYGDNAARAYWYGDLHQCQAMAKRNPPRECRWQRSLATA